MQGLYLFCLLVCKCVCGCSGQYLVVNTTEGALRGHISTQQGQYPEGTLHNFTITQFLGVPFAKPPVAKLRWKSPVRHDPWQGVRDATEYGNVCYQQANPLSRWSIYNMSEDCLVLNIYIPGNITNMDELKGRNLTTMMWIHGGSFQTGTGNGMNGYYITNDHNVILVTVNYRLGVIGYFTTEDSQAEGNYGMQDNIMALQWVKENIQNFGGNPDSVTIFGESAGGAAVSHLMLSPKAEGLFRRAITQSGVATAYWAIGRNYLREEAISLGEKIGCPVETSEGLVNCLRTKDPAIVTNSSLDVYFERMVTRNDTQVRFRPRIDGNYIMDEPINVLKSGSFFPYDYMTGVCSHEGYFLWNIQPIVGDKSLSTGINSQDFDKLIQLYMRNLNNVDQRYKVAKAIKLMYDDYLNAGDSTSRSQTYVDFVSDYTFLADNDRVAKLYAKKATNVFNYYFSPRVSDDLRVLSYPTPIPDWVKASHADDIPFVFGLAKYALWGNITHEERKLSDQVMRAWANFANTGSPGTVGGVAWERFNSSQPSYLDLTVPVSNINHVTPLLPRRMAFWDDFVWPMLDQPQTTNCPTVTTGMPSQPSEKPTKPSAAPRFTLTNLLAGVTLVMTILLSHQL